MADDPLQGNQFLENDESFKEMMALFNEKTYFQRLKGMFDGLKQPKDTKEYKLARIEMQRQAAPVAAVVIPVVLVTLLALFASKKQTTETAFETDIMEVEELQEQLEDIPQDMPEPQPMDDIMPNDVQFTPEMALDIAAPAPDAPVSAQPQSVDAVAVVKSPVILRNIFGSTRNPGMRGQLIAAGGGNAKTEASVIRALRWLKAVQNPDGSWPNNKVAMTGLVILTFLAHGEKPGDSPEFGECVQKAMEYLIMEQDRTGGGLFTTAGNGYAHAIATYAMCEAYGMTMNPNVKAAADKGLEVIINGQHPSGGWDYNWKQSERDDTSVMGWAAQALKAGIMANFYHDPEALERASRLCVKGFKKNGFSDGGFGYTAPQKGGLTGVGTLCMQFHHAANDSYVKNSLQNIIYNWKPEWVGYTPARAAAGEKLEKPTELAQGVVGGACPQYYYYYGTQAVFQAGGDRWKQWNDRMWPSYVAAQFIVPKGEPGSSCSCPICKSGSFGGKLKEPYTDDKGNLQEIGHWVNTDAHTDRPIMDTCLAALQMMVYYRYLPTFKQVDVPAEVVADTKDSGDIQVDTDL